MNPVKCNHNLCVCNVGSWFWNPNLSSQWRKILLANFFSHEMSSVSLKKHQVQIDIVQPVIIKQVRLLKVAAAGLLLSIQIGFNVALLVTPSQQLLGTFQSFHNEKSHYLLEVLTYSIQTRCNFASSNQIGRMRFNRNILIGSVLVRTFKRLSFQDLRRCKL